MHYKYYAMILWILFKPIFLTHLLLTLLWQDKANRTVGCCLITAKQVQKPGPPFCPH